MVHHLQKVRFLSAEELQRGMNILTNQGNRALRYENLDVELNHREIELLDNKKVLYKIIN